MSFAGHVYDMIQRNKENRDMLKRRREKNSERREKYLHTEIPTYNLEMNLEELEEINRNTKERELLEKQYYLRMTLTFIGVAVITGLLFILIFKFFIS